MSKNAKSLKRSTKSNQWKIWLLVVLILATLAFIWGNSMVTGTESGSFSTRIREAINSFLGSAGLSNLQMADDFIVRKTGHAAEYAILGIELTLLLWVYQNKPWSLLFLCGMSAGLIDETIQLFTPNRAGLITDVWIDFTGFCIGSLLIMLFNQKTHRRRR
ncbi:MAG: VanZ family protein [Eubacteriaceae bacterium]|jgi:VanZ family protein